MIRTTPVLLLLAASIPATAAASQGGHAGGSQTATSAQAARSLPERSRAGSNLYLFLGERKLDCANDNLAPDGELRDCSLHVPVEVDGPVSYEGNVVVGCEARFKLRYLRAYHPLTNSVSRKVTVHVKNGLGKAVAELPVRQTGTLHSIAGYRLLKVGVDKLSCKIDSRG